MIQRFLSHATPIMISLMLATLILHIFTLFNTVSVLQERRTAVQDIPKGYSGNPHSDGAISLRWNKGVEFAYVFDNSAFHITSEEEWASLSHVEAIQLQAHRQSKPDTAESHTYIISMQQQLHCLNVVRVAHLSYHQSKPKLDPSFYEEADMCIEQLRQHIMCNSDITLDPTEYFVHSSGVVEPQTNGTVALHRCRNWRELETAIFKSSLR